MGIPIGYQRAPYRNAHGIYLHIQVQKGRSYPGWVAYWQRDGRQRFKRYNFGKIRTSDEAYHLALAWREQMITRDPTDHEA